MPLAGEALLGGAALPEVERVLRADAPDEAVAVAGAVAPVGAATVLEEREVVAVAGLLVAVEDVVRRHVGLVDRLLDDPQAHDAHVEVGVARRVRRDARDVVDPLQLHARTIPSGIVGACPAPRPPPGCRSRTGSRPRSSCSPRTGPAAGRSTASASGSGGRRAASTGTSPTWTPSSARWPSAGRST